MRAEKYRLNPSGVQFERLEEFSDGYWNDYDWRRRRVIVAARSYERNGASMARLIGIFMNSAVELGR